MRKPTKAELKVWEDQLKKDHLSMRRGESNRLVYGNKETCRLMENSWSKAKLWQKRKRKTNKKTEHVCIVCGSKFLGREGAKCCPRPKSCREQLRAPRTTRASRARR